MADNNKLETFINVFKGGNRTHLYDVTMNWPSALANETSDDLTLNRFFVRAVSLPPSQINPIRIPYRGRILKWPGDRVYYPWTFRVLDQNEGGDASHKSIWNKFQDWSNVINSHSDNISSDNWNSFTTDWVIKQVDHHGTIMKKITLHDCWPTVIGPISMDSNAIDTIVEFTVTVEYQWFTINDGA